MNKKNKLIGQNLKIGESDMGMNLQPPIIKDKIIGQYPYEGDLIEMNMKDDQIKQTIEGISECCEARKEQIINNNKDNDNMSERLQKNRISWNVF